MPAKIITLTNQKGGVGKTTLACHLAYAARERGARVLVVDLDTQANATSTLTQRTDLLHTAGGAETIFTGTLTAPTVTADGIHVLHGHQALDGVHAAFTDPNLKPEDQQRRMLQLVVSLRPFVRSLPYDVVIFDTPPALGLLHIAPLIWAHRLITPTEPNLYGLAGAANLSSEYSDAKSVNPDLELVVIVNRMNPASKVQQDYAQQLKTLVPVHPPYLTQRTHVSEALDLARPVWRYSKARKSLRQTWHTLSEELVA